MNLFSFIFGALLAFCVPSYLMGMLRRANGDSASVLFLVGDEGFVNIWDCALSLEWE